jgi:dTDP-4-dehydrorhamnose reductase
MTRVLVLGAGGMLGHKLCQLLPEQGFEVWGTLRRPTDFSSLFARVQLMNGVEVLNEASLSGAIEQAQPDVIVNCVGIIKQKREAENRYLSVAINSWLPHQLSRLCAEAGQRLIHISTDCVFSGTKGNYRESDLSDATDLYGKSKFLGETDDSEPAAITLRTSIIGRELGDPGTGLLEWFLAQQGAGQAQGFALAIFSGFTTHELANVIGLVIRDFPRLHGLYQIASTPISKYELLRLIGDVYDLPIEVERNEVFQCDRSLLADRFHAATGYAPPDWPTMIKRMHADPTAYSSLKQSLRELTEKWLNHAFKSC